jgi:hypothetical protein
LKANHSADIGVPSWQLYSGALVTESEFAALAGSSLGANRLGVLRMDVDRLGRIFSRGLEHRTLARMSDLSERLDYFFKVVIPKHPEALLEHGLFSNVERNPSLAVVYSGGDDLFLVGAWDQVIDQVIDVAFAISKLFSDYVGGNPNVTLSAGIVIADYRLALQKLAALAGEEEKRAKAQGRSRFSLGEHSTARSWRLVEGVYCYRLRQLGVDPFEPGSSRDEQVLEFMKERRYRLDRPLLFCEAQDVLHNFDKDWLFSLQNTQLGEIQLDVPVGKSSVNNAMYKTREIRNKSIVAHGTASVDHRQAAVSLASARACLCYALKGKKR